MKDNPKARASLDAEYNVLCDNLKAWDTSGEIEWFVVQAQAKRNGKRNHAGVIFGICVEKNAEIFEGHPNRKSKVDLCSRETTSGTRKT